MNFIEHWDKRHMKFENVPVSYDNWLDDYSDTINMCKTKVLDLGSGTGNDTLYFVEKGLNVIASDYSDVSLALIKKNIPQAEVMKVDISKPMPFDNDSFDLVVADLCLHYFNDKTTKEIMREIKRVLTPNGHLIARVNSTEDINHGAGQGVKIEDNYYYVEGYNKRFFDFTDAEKYFSIIGKVKIKKNNMLRYSKPKVVIEVDVEKI